MACCGYQIPISARSSGIAHKQVTTPTNRALKSFPTNPSLEDLAPCQKRPSLRTGLLPQTTPEAPHDPSSIFDPHHRFIPFSNDVYQFLVSTLIDQIHLNFDSRGPIAVRLPWPHHTTSHQSCACCQGDLCLTSLKLLQIGSLNTTIPSAVRLGTSMSRKITGKW